MASPKDTVLFIDGPESDHVLAVESLADGEVRAWADFGMEVLDIVPEAAGECIAGGGGHDDAGAFGIFQPVKQSKQRGVKALGAGGRSGPGNPVVVAEAFQARSIQGCQTMPAF